MSFGGLEIRPQRWACQRCDSASSPGGWGCDHTFHLQGAAGVNRQDTGQTPGWVSGAGAGRGGGRSSRGLAVPTGLLRTHLGKHYRKPSQSQLLVDPGSTALPTAPADRSPQVWGTEILLVGK